jgi:hypothetical protein
VPRDWLVALYEALNESQAQAQRAQLTIAARRERVRKRA